MANRLLQILGISAFLFGASEAAIAQQHPCPDQQKKPLITEQVTDGVFYLDSLSSADTSLGTSLDTAIINLHSRVLASSAYAPKNKGLLLDSIGGRTALVSREGMFVFIDGYTLNTQTGEFSSDPDPCMFDKVFDREKEGAIENLLDKGQQSFPEISAYRENNSLVVDFRSGTVKIPLADLYFSHGKQHYKGGRYADAVLVLREAFRLDAKNMETANLLGGAYYHLKQYADARTFIKYAVQLSPQSAILHSNLALVLYDSGKTDEAKKEALEAQRLDQNNESSKRLLDRISKTIIIVGKVPKKDDKSSFELPHKDSMTTQEAFDVLNFTAGVGILSGNGRYRDTIFNSDPKHGKTSGATLHADISPEPFLVLSRQYDMGIFADGGITWRTLYSSISPQSSTGVWDSYGRMRGRAGITSNVGVGESDGEFVFGFLHYFGI